MRRYERPDIGSTLLSVSPTSLRGGQWIDHPSQIITESGKSDQTPLAVVVAADLAILFRSLE